MEAIKCPNCRNERIMREMKEQEDKERRILDLKRRVKNSFKEIKRSKHKDNVTSSIFDILLSQAL